MKTVVKLAVIALLGCTLYWMNGEYCRVCCTGNYCTQEGPGCPRRS